MCVEHACRVVLGLWQSQADVSFLSPLLFEETNGNTTLSRTLLHFFFFIEFLIGFSHDAARVPSSWKALMLVLTPPGLGHVTC